MNLSFPSDCPNCGSIDKPFKLIQRETEQDFLGEIYRITSPLLECRHCGSTSIGPGQLEALRQAMHDAYRTKHGLDRCNPTYRELNILNGEISDLKSEKNRHLSWLSESAPAVLERKKRIQGKENELKSLEQQLLQDLDDLAELRGEEFARLNQKIKELESDIFTCSKNSREVQALFETERDGQKKAEIRAKNAELETKNLNSEIKILNRTITKLENQIEKLKPGSEVFEREIERLKSQLATQKENRKIAESNHHNAKSEINLLKCSLGENEREFRNLESRYAREQGLLDKEKAKVGKIRQDLEATLKEAEETTIVRAALKVTEDRLRRKERQLEKANEKIQGLTTQIEIKSIFHLTDERVIRWLSSGIEGRTWDVPEYATILGEGPIFSNQMCGHLSEWSCAPYLNGCEWIIVGREDWTPARLDELIAEREDEEIKIVSQELFIAAVISGQDPFLADEEILLAFAEGHPALEYLRDAGFEWPFICEWIDEEPEDYWFMGAEISPLKAMGYTVGESGLYEGDRRYILTNAFEGELERVEPKEYMELWGSPGSRHRLRQMAYHISRQIPKHRGMYNHDTAVREWEEDLEWLYYEFYKPWMRFRWPGHAH